MADINLPAEVLALANFPPIEDVLLELLSDGLGGIPVCSLIPEEPTWPFVLARKVSNNIATWNGDPRFVDRARFSIQAFTEDPDGDEAGAILSEAIRVLLFRHWMDHTVLASGASIASIKMAASPVRVTDWATSAGPVQYADLPTGKWRYEAQYVLVIHKIP